MVKRKLTMKQKKFVQEVIKARGNGTQAALNSYDTTDPNTAGVIAHDNLRIPKISAAIEEAFRKEDLNEEWVLKRLKIEALDKDNQDSSRIKSVELVGKYLDMFKETKKLETTLTIKDIYGFMAKADGGDTQKDV